MKLKEVQALTDDELRIKVAELCGWKRIRKVDWALIDVSELSTCSGWEGMRNELEGYISIPDYTRDLNAMHEAEKHLPLANNMYLAWLEFITGGGEYDCNEEKVCMATARQRAEAFVMVWEGD